MELTDSRTIQRFALKALSIIAVLFFGRFVYQGFQSRRRVRKLAAQGIPILPHSWLTGHILVLRDFVSSHPSDVSFFRFPKWIMDNAQKYFPDLGGDAPGVVYVDLWPITYSYAFVFDAEANTQFTVAQSLDKHPVVGDYLNYMTQGKDLFAGNGSYWKTWRNRLNPGFSARHMATLLPELLEEVTIFVDVLKSQAGADGSWGEVFQLEPKAISLTFDIICRTILDMRLNDQTTVGGHPLKNAMVNQINLINEAFVSLRHRIPFTRTAKRLQVINQYNDTTRELVLPGIMNKINGVAPKDGKQTAVDLTLKTMGKGSKQTSLDTKDQEFIDELIANLKIMMFAGHDTTAITICMMFKCLQENPHCLQELRNEHNSVLGSNPHQAAAMLTTNPNLIHNLPYTLAVIKETLRIYPIASTVRKGVKDCVLRPKGESLEYPTEGWAPWTAISVIHRDEKYWPRPEEFLPERWTCEAGHPLYPILKQAWLGFALGPRNCIGMELALTELKLVACLTARTLEIREAWDAWDIKQGTVNEPKDMIQGQRMYMIGAGTMHPKDGLPVSVRVVS